MKKLCIYFCVPAFLLFAAPTLNAQVLFEEDFDGYPAGDFISDQTSTIPDQGGWYCGITTGQPTADAIVTPESGKGNVLIVTPNGTSSSGSGSISFRQAQGVVSALWNNRTAGNNIMKFEYEFYGAGIFNVFGSISSQATNLINMAFQTNQSNRIGANYFNTTSNTHITLLSFNTTPFPDSTWIKAEMYIDYNTSDVYFYLPALNILETRSFSHNRIPEGITFNATVEQSAVVKWDNIKLSALQTLPSHLVSVRDFVSEKFAVFPNPVKDIITISNNESIGIEQVKVFDISGKTIKSLNFNNEKEVQLNIGDFASGMYLLHIKTNEGTAVKKVVKK